MAIFAPIKIQESLDTCAAFVTGEHLHDWIKRLNDVADAHLPTEWEVVLLAAFARLGAVEHEPDLGGKKHLDVVFYPPAPLLSFAADVIAISDATKAKLDPNTLLYEELKTRIKKHKINDGGFVLRIDDMSQIPERTTKQRRRRLPARIPFTDSVFTEEFEAFMQSVRSEPTMARRFGARHQNPEAYILVFYEPDGNDVECISLGQYLNTSVLDDNPLYNALKRKASELRLSNYDGIKGIIACDADSLILGPPRTGWSFSLRAVVSEAMRQNTSIDFVLTLGVGYDRDRGPKLLPGLYLAKPTDWSSSLAATLDKVIDALPQVERMPAWAQDEIRATGNRKTSRFRTCAFSR